MLYLRKTELFFKLTHCTQMLFFAVPQSCVSGPALLLLLLFFNPWHNGEDSMFVLLS